MTGLQTQNPVSAAPTSSSLISQVLLVEDEPDMAQLIGLNLGTQAVQVTNESDGARGLQRALSQTWDLVILDLRLPGLSGLEICREMRARQVECPILMLTALGTELDKVVGLESGADDYLTKPFGVLELQARARALLRRFARSVNKSQSDNEFSDCDEMLQLGSLRIDRRRHRVWIDGTELKLTRREFELLWYFASRPSEVFSRGELLDNVWGTEHSGYEHTVNSHINRLRAKLAKPADTTVSIDTVWGVGYRLVVDPAHT